MPVVRHKKIAFVHVPKTGGSTIKKILRMNFGSIDLTGGYEENGVDRTHWTKERLLQHDQTFADFFWFCFVRNPWDRLVSEWQWQKKGSKSKKHGHDRFFYADFNEFVFFAITQCQTNRFFWCNHWRPQTDFIDDEMDFIGRMENYEADVRKVFALLDVKLDSIPRKNGSRLRLNYRDLYDEHARKIVADFYAEDIRRFGYSF
jgi:hypothetical protein